MQSLLERIKQGDIWDFRGGIHPPGRKTLSNQRALIHIPVPNELVIPLKQHIGRPGHLLVKVGDRVLRGQPLTEAREDFELPVHASSSGEIIAIEPRPIAHPSALPDLCVVIRTDGKDDSIGMPPISDYHQAPANALIERIQLCGVAGLGGAGFPTRIKLQAGRRGIDLLIINAAECEPYITADDSLLQAHAREVLQGIAILKHILQPKLVIIGIEDDMPEAIEALEGANQDNNVVIRVVPTKYPSGGERQLIEVLTGKQVPQGGIPADIGMLVHNVGSAYAVKRAVIDGEPLTERVVTLTGEQFPEPGNAWVRLGTPIDFIIKQSGLAASTLSSLIMGGPMMGFTLPHPQIPVVKTTNCLLAPAEAELSMESNEQPCIRCRACAEACPASLLPQQLLWYAKADDKEKLDEYDLFDCIECGACAYVCPSEIPLVHYYRKAKADVRRAEEEALKAQRAKERFEARKARLEREKHEREERHRKAAAARMEAMKQRQPEEDPVAAAIARVKAKQPAGAVTDEQSMAEMRQARKQLARQRKAEKTSLAEGTEEPSSSPSTKPDAVAAAIARAKAKKAAASEEAAAAPPEQDGPRKAAVAAAIARAKAKKAAASEEAAAAPPEQDGPRKAAVAAAIARAKAKKAAASEEAAAASPENDGSRKAAVAAAIARAKAKKAAASEETSGQSARHLPDKQQGAATQQDKSAAVARAVAKAKARKAASERQSRDQDKE